MRRTKEDAELTRQQLLKAGLKVFSEKGYAASRLSDVAEEAGVTRGAIYWHFKNKKELFIALFKDTIDPFFDLLKKVLDEDLEPLQKLTKVMMTVFERIDSDAEFRANQAMEFSDRKLQQEIPELREYLKGRSDKLYILFVKLIVAGMERGEIRKDVEPEIVISMLGMLFRGYGFVMTGGGMTPFFHGKDTSQMVDIFITGIKA